MDKRIFAPMPATEVRFDGDHVVIEQTNPQTGEPDAVFITMYCLGDVIDAMRAVSKGG